MKSEYTHPIRTGPTLYHVPSLNDCRHLTLATRRENEAIKNIESFEGRPWEELKSEGWVIDTFWSNEYE